MIDEDLFAGALRRAVSTLEPPTARLVDAAVAQGRRRRRVRRAVQAATGVALLAAVVGLVLILLPGRTAEPQRRDVVGAPAATSRHAAAPTRRTVMPVVTPQALLQTALAGLPRAGRTTHYTGRSMPGFVGTEFVYDDGHGRVEVAVGLEYGPGAETAKQFCHDTQLRCQRRAPAGTLATHRGRTRPGDDTTAREWTADLFRVDGVHVSITEWNSSQEKDAPITRTVPPFTIPQLTRWIEHTHWQVAISVEQARRAAPLFTPDR